jgi:uncharacterized protein YciI
MSWLVVRRPVREEMPFEPTEDEAQIVADHFAYLQRLHDDGRLVLAGPSPVPGDSFGLDVYDVDDRAEVEAILAVDPAIASGIMTAEIRPFRISLR